MKPESMSHKEWLIKKMSLERDIPEKIINAVVTHQFDSAREALKDNDTVEISNFGKFSFNRKRAKYKMEKFLAQKKMYEEQMSKTFDEAELRNLSLRLKSINNNIEFLKSKLYVKGSTDIGGVG
jgi:nucleoid DNA-binding protein